MSLFFLCDERVHSNLLSTQPSSFSLLPTETSMATTLTVTQFKTLSYIYIYILTTPQNIMYPMIKIIKINK